MNNKKPRESGWYWCDECNLDIWEPIYYNANYRDDEGAWDVPSTGMILDSYVDFNIDERKIERGSNV